MNHANNKVSRFTTMIASDIEHERVFVEIYYDQKFVALVSQEPGERTVLEFPGPDLVEDLICRTVELDGFLQAVQLATSRLRSDTETEQAAQDVGASKDEVD